MAGKTVPFANAVLKLFFNGTPIPGLADNASASPLTIWECSLHTAMPTTDQSHYEVNYEGYSRIAVARSTAGFVVNGNGVSPVNAIVFPECISGKMYATHLGIGTEHTGAGVLMFRYPLSPAISIYPGQDPRIKNTSIIWEV